MILVYFQVKSYLLIKISQIEALQVGRGDDVGTGFVGEGGFRQYGLLVTFTCHCPIPEHEG